MSYPAEPSNPLTNKLGPLPVWAWGGLALLVAILFYMYSKNKSNKAQNTAANTPGGVDASLVPQFVNQTFVENTPPAAPNMHTPEKEPDNDKDDKKLRGKPIPGGVYEIITVTKTGWASTLQGISKQEKVSVAEIAKLNHIPSNAHLHVGQKLKVPKEPGEKAEK